MNNDDEALSSARKKLDREKALMNAANAMRLQTNNESVRSRLDAQMREGRRNIQYLEDTLHQLQMRRMGHGMESVSLHGDNVGPAGRPYGSGPRDNRDAPPAPPPKDSRGRYVYPGSDRGYYGSQEYSQIGGHGDMMPPRHPYAPPAPGSNNMPRSRPNYSKLGMLRYRIMALTLVLMAHQISLNMIPHISGPASSSCCPK
jgi:hypothetical protein